MQPLVSLCRANYDEIVIHGEVVVVGDAGVEFQSDASIGTYPARSLLKPFQFLVGGYPRQPSGGPKDYERYAACLGSLAATKEQVAQLQVWYGGPARAKLLAAHRLPPVFPADEIHRVELKSRKVGPSPWFHQCFANHMGILEACQLNNWDLGTYVDPAHPFHVKLLTSLSSWLSTPVTPDVWVEDGCLLPTPALRLDWMARLYQRLAAASGQDPFVLIRELMLQYPEWIAGPNQLATELMKLNAGRLIVKSGADGLLALALPESKLSILIKISAGYYPELLMMALVPLLDRLGLKHTVKYPRAQTPKYFYSV